MSCAAPERAREHLLIVSRSMPPDIGGYQRQFTLLAPYLAQEFDGVEWIGAVRDDPIHSGSTLAGVDRMRRLPGHRIPRAVRGVADPAVIAVSLAVLAAHRARRRRVRILLLSPTMWGGAVLARVAGWLGADVVARYPTTGDLTSTRGRRVGVQRRVRSIAPSPQQVREQDRFAVALVPNAVDVPPEVDRDSRPSRGRSVLYVGRLVARKRVDVLIAAWGRVRRELPGWTLHVVGDGGSESDSVESDIRGMVAQDGDCRVSLRGRIADAREMMSEADVFVFPSSNEGMPNSLLEALAAGLPVIAEAERVADWFERMPPLVSWDGTVEGLAGALQAAANDDDLRRRLGRAGRTFVIEHHSPAVAVDAIVSLR